MFRSSTKILSFSLATLITNAFGNIALAQTDTDAVKNQNNELIDGAAFSAIANSIGGSNAPSVLISLEGDDANASLQYVWEEIGAGEGEIGDSHETQISQRWAFTLKAPIESGGKERKNFADLDRLASGIKTSLQYSRGHTFDFVDYWPEGVDEGDSVGRTLAGVDQAMTNCQALRTDKCDTPDPNDRLAFVSKYAPDFYENFLTPKSKSFWYGVNIDAGVDDFTYLDPTGLMEMTDQKFQYGAGVSASYFDFNRKVVLSAGGQYSSAFESAESKENCIMVGSDQKCATGSLGKPVRKDNWVGFLEARKLIKFSSQISDQIGITARVSHDFESNVTGVSVPIQVKRNDGGLGTGFQIGWRSDTDDVTAGLFFGGSFDFIGG